MRSIRSTKTAARLALGDEGAIETNRAPFR
jgi:hypothetical protein